MPAMLVEHEVDPKTVITNALGDLSKIETSNNQVLVAVYQRGGTGDGKEIKTAGGILVPVKNLEEDRFQSKVGLIVKVGPLAFKDDSGKYAWPDDIGVGDWVMYRASDGWSFEIIGDPPRVDNKVNKVLCRLLDDTAIRARIQHPDTIW